MTVRVRIAPSPTGNLHIGTARTALFNWLFAKHHGGEFVLRIEDTDLERSDKKYEKNIIDGLRWLGLTWDGEIYRQSKRLDVYKGYLKELMDSGKAFWCHHTFEELSKEKEQQVRNKEPQRHLCNDKNGERGKTKGEIIRLAVDWNADRKIQFEDLVRGRIESSERLLGDLSLAKDLNTPLYNFAVVVDDAEMEISHVIRGEDHISNTPKQILLYEALGKKAPFFGHLPLILATDRSKLSKRNGAVSVDEYKKDYLPEALINFVGFLGYTYDREIIGLEYMAKEFDIAKVHKSGAIFNIEKLNWINAQYVKQLEPVVFKKLVKLPKLPDNAVPLVTERLERLSDIKQFDFFWKKPKYEASLLAWKNAPSQLTVLALNRAADIFSNFDFSSKEVLRVNLDNASEGDRGSIYWPLRVALTGLKASPDPVDVAFVLGKAEVLARINAAIKKVGLRT